MEDRLLRMRCQRIEAAEVEDQVSNVMSAAGSAGRR